MERFELLIRSLLLGFSMFIVFISLMIYNSSKVTKNTFVKQDNYSSIKSLESKMRKKVIEIEEYEERMKLLQRVRSPLLSWYKYVLKIFLSNKTKISISNILIIMASIVGVISFITLMSQGPLVTVVIILATTILLLNILNILSVLNRKKSRKEVLSFLSIFHTNYMRSDSIEGAVKKTLDSIDKSSWIYAVLEEYMTNFFKLGRSRAECIDIFKKNIGGFNIINTYFDIVKKAETTSPSYKYSTNSIPENFELNYVLQNGLASNILVGFGTYAVITILIIGMTIKMTTDFALLELINTNIKTRLFSTIPYIMSLITGIIIFVISSDKGD